MILSLEFINFAPVCGVIVAWVPDASKHNSLL